MTPGFDAESTFVMGEQPLDQVLAQFEPDPYAAWDTEPAPAAATGEGADDLPWIVWADAAREAAWAASELLAWIAVARRGGRPA